MKTPNTPIFDCFAFGNALIDYEFSIQNDFLAKLGVQKGCMELVDANRILEIEEIALKNSIQPQKISSGGSAANSMHALSLLGSHACFACNLGNDEKAFLYAQDLIAHKLQLIASHTQAINGQCMVFVTPDGERTMCTHLGASVEGIFTPSIKAAISHSRLVYLEGYLVSIDETKELMQKIIQQAKDKGCKVALSLSDPNLVKFFRTQFLELIPQIDWLFGNESEIAELLEFAGEMDEQQLKTYIASLKLEYVFTTRGASPTLAMHNSEEAEFYPVQPSQVVDTTGAGDAFAGGVIHGLSQGASLDEAINLGNNIASRCVAKWGARLTSEDLQAIETNF